MQFSRSERTRALLFPPANQQTVDYLRSQFAHIGAITNPQIQSFAQMAQAEFEKNYSAAAEQRRQMILNELARTSAHAITQIVELTDVCDLQVASPIMQRYIMAEPAIRQAWLDGTLAGYAGSYTTHQPDAVGIWHDDYQIATQGLLVDNGDEPAQLSIYVSSHDLEVLTLSQQEAIEMTWAHVRYFADMYEEDPTSAEGLMR